MPGGQPVAGVRTTPVFIMKIQIVVLPVVVLMLACGDDGVGTTAGPTDSEGGSTASTGPGTSGTTGTGTTTGTTGTTGTGTMGPGTAGPGTTGTGGPGTTGSTGTATGTGGSSTGTAGTAGTTTGTETTGSSGGSSGSGSTGGSGGCTWSKGSNPCGRGQYCDAPGCGAGICQPIGTTDNPVKAAVCGCDGVNYWNADTAATYGMAVQSDGPCPRPTVCGGIGGLTCPTNLHFCGYLLQDSTECLISDPMGVCWGMPDSCTTIGFGGTWRSCAANPGSACAYECDAIKAGSRHWPDDLCPQ